MNKLSDFENNIINGPGCFICILCLIIIIILWQFVPANDQDYTERETQKQSKNLLYIQEDNCNVC